MKSRYRVLAFVVVLSGCTGSSSVQAPPPIGAGATAVGRGTVSTAGQREAPILRRAVDDWTTYAHDQQRTSLANADPQLNEQSVTQLHARWTVPWNSEIDASPIVAGGGVYVADANGVVRALDAQTGAQRWSVALGKPVRMTPTLVGTRLIVGTHDTSSPQPTNLVAAIDSGSGQVLWRATVTGLVRSEPAAIGSTVYIGIAGGDPPGCVQGGLLALDIASGRTLWYWTVDPNPNDGGSVWSPISVNGNSLIFGTGNDCSGQQFYTNSVVALGTDGTTKWSTSIVPDPSLDWDVGGGALLVGSTIFYTGKNGYLASLSADSGMQQAVQQITPYGGTGSIGTPSTDGTTLVTSIGSLGQVFTGPVGGGLTGTTFGLRQLWTIATQYPYNGYVAIAAGMGFATLDTHLVAFDLPTGRVLWTSPSGAPFYASPVVVPSGIYVADTAGTVTAYGF